MINLAWVDVDCPDDNISSERPTIGRAWKDRATRAPLWNKFGKVPGPVSAPEGSFFPEVVITISPGLSGGYGLKRFGVQKFKDVVGLPIMDAFVVDAIKPCARTIKFGQSGISKTWSTPGAPSSSFSGHRLNARAHNHFLDERFWFSDPSFDFLWP